MSQANIGTAAEQVLEGPRVYHLTRDRHVSRAESIRPPYFWAVALGIFLTAFVVRMWNLGYASLWSDEVLTAGRAHLPLSQSLSSILSAGNQTPTYFMLMRLFPNQSEDMLRLPSVLMGMISIALIMLIAIRLYRSYDLALWVGGLMVANPYHVWLSRTARSYMLLLVLSLAASYFFLRLARGHRSTRTWVAYGVFSMLAYLTHYTTIALPAAQFVFLFFNRHEPNFKRLSRFWVLVQGLSVLPVAAWLYIVSQNQVNVGEGRFPTPTISDIPLTFWNMTIGYDGNLRWYIVPGLMIVMLGLIYGMWFAFKERQRNPENFYWLLLVLCPLVPTFIISKLFVSFYLDRYFMAFLPGLIFLLPLGLRRNSEPLWRAAMIVIMVTGMQAILFSFTIGSHQRTNWRSASEYIASEIEPGDAILLQWGYTNQAFRYYFDPQLQPGVDPKFAILFDTPDTTQLERTSQRVWAVYRNPAEDPHVLGVMPDYNIFQPGVTDLGDWLTQRQQQVISVRKFNGVSVVLLETQVATASTDVATQ
jgi:uncharacterized membrane protein